VPGGRFGRAEKIRWKEAIEKEDDVAVPRLWVRWLEVLGGLFVVLGVYMAVAGGNAAFAPFRALVDPVFWGEGEPPGEARSFEGWIYAVLGGMMVGWGILTIALARFGIAEGARWAWRALVAAVVGWFVFDTTGSALAGAWFNVIGNVAILVVSAVPLVAVRDRMR
jgi:hypothetical protein